MQRLIPLLLLVSACNYQRIDSWHLSKNNYILLGKESINKFKELL